MNVKLTQELQEIQSQRYEILPESPLFEEVEYFNNKKKRNKIIYGSPLWCRDSTKRLQRKPIRKSMSLESAINEVGDLESSKTIHEEDDTGLNSTSFNNSTPRWEKQDYKCLNQPRRNIMPVKNGKIFNSTMMERGNLETLFGRSEELSTLNHRNHTGKVKM